jgi:transcriptional regulator with XRE-family HTH domain
MNLGKAIKLCRTQREFTQAELADRACISKSYLSLIERGKRDPSFSTFQDIAAALEIPESILVFLAADSAGIEALNPDLAEKLSHTTLKLIGALDEPTSLH